MIYNYDLDNLRIRKELLQSLLKYEQINKNVADDNIKRFSSLYNNENNLFYYFVQRNIKDGKKLKYCNIMFNVLKLLQRYSQYGLYQNSRHYRFEPGFNYYFCVLKRYLKFLPNFTLKLENEYKGKHKTKRKFMYPVFLETLKSQLNELSLWFKRISYKYKYRDFSTRLSIIFFNYIYFLGSKINKITVLSNKIFTMQKGSSRIFLTDDKAGRDFLLSDTYKKTLWKLTFNRLRIKLRPKVDWYYRSLFYAHKNNLGYIAKHSLNAIKVDKYLKILQKSNLLSDREFEIGRQEYYRNLSH